MKTPEEILHFHITEREPIISYTDYRIAALAAMEENKEQVEKSMQSEHEKEMESFAEWIEKNGYSQYWGSDGLNRNKWYQDYTTPTRTYYTTAELLTQFRNKQQDR